MRTVFLTQFGSTIYGTSTPTSDTDVKGIFIPKARDIVMQSVQDSINQTTKINKDSRNTPEDVDTEYFSLQKYMELLLEGQTVALDMLFSPPDLWIGNPEIAWFDIQQHKEKFLHKGLSAFTGYCRTQAAKYGIKGTRIASLRVALDYLKTFPKEEKLLNLDLVLWVLSVQNEFISITEIRNPRGQMEPYLQVNGRKIPFHATVKYAVEILEKIFNEYGARALLAEKNEGVDWKALSHAVRVCSQAKELLTDHVITFPRPDAALLLQVKKGELPYNQVAEIIEQGMLEVEEATKNSTLPEKPDRALAEKIVEEYYSSSVVNEYGEVGFA